MSRGSLVVFDECGFLDEEMMSVYAAFVIVNKSFATGKDRDGNSIDFVRTCAMPDNIRNQLFYISSASSTDTEFWRLYRDFSKRMFLGDTNYFVAHIDCEVAMKPTKHGKVISPLLTRDTVEAAMRANPEKARREYYCQFTSDAGTNSIVKRAAIARNSVTTVPLLFNDTNDKKFVICYDPARSRDNSIILVAEIYEADGEYKMRIVNCVNLLDVNKSRKKKSPMQTPEQIEYLKELILDYNGDTVDYDNIIDVMIDAGAGGAGVNIADYLMEDWTDKAGNKHRGLIDKVYSEAYVKKFPNAVNKVKLMSPTQYKSEMYEALIEMMNQNAIEFPAEYDNKGYLTIIETDEKVLKKAKAAIEEDLKKEKLSQEEYTERLNEELAKVNCMKTKVVKLDIMQEIALTNIDALKEEMVNIVRKERESGKDSFDLSPEKANKMHDDRSYCIAMAAYCLQQLRRKNIIGKKKKRQSSQLYNYVRAPKKVTQF